MTLLNEALFGQLLRLQDFCLHRLLDAPYSLASNAIYMVHCGANNISSSCDVLQSKQPIISFKTTA